ncbi:iron-sulfur cluster repair protein YtfE (RIC family) [Natronospira proteinivora]|uniref:Iron-sulfur cluster repair protein YtfE (RIC family) n=1 Tax=Natronospira proteinivora TaxID=1807133 RepID=A0ABT1G7I7_9GAMM|nr:hemerythrin domain-containing protein [Natronospira proteinivora]MCP1727186.1 iron-sulfur cluster repair protein YtfE (RIC family) [Natronospira proteinivora]
MKRSPTLQPLSREHNTALKLARDARQAAAHGSEKEVAGVWRRLCRTWFTEMASHFRAEEELLFPLLQAQGETELVKQLLREHQAMRRTLEDANRQDRARLDAIGNVLNDHVRREEREAFPKLEAYLSPETAERIDHGLALTLASLKEKQAS